MSRSALQDRAQDSYQKDPGFEAPMVVLSESEKGSPFRRMPPYRPIARLAAV
ncbi:unnamed protein product, partial [Rangifer tarandus platyrhynchus]